MKQLTDDTGRVLDENVAFDMAHIEKPFRENKIGFIKGLFTSRANEILKGQNRSTSYLVNLCLNEQRKEKERLKEEKYAKALNILFNSDELNKFTEKINTSNTYYYNSGKFKALYGKIDGLKFEIKSKLRRRVAFKYSDGKKEYEYFWEHNGNLEGATIDNPAYFYETYYIAQKSETGKGDVLTTDELEIYNIFKQGHHDLIKIRDEVKDGFIVSGKIGKHEILLTSYSKTMHKHGIPVAIHGVGKNLIDGKNMSEELGTLIWQQVPYRE